MSKSELIGAAMIGIPVAIGLGSVIHHQWSAHPEAFRVFAATLGVIVWFVCGVYLLTKDDPR